MLVFIGLQQPKNPLSCLTHLPEHWMAAKEQYFQDDHTPREDTQPYVRFPECKQQDIKRKDAFNAFWTLCRFMVATAAVHAIDIRQGTAIAGLLTLSSL